MSVQNIHDKLMMGIGNEVGVAVLMGSIRAESRMSSINLQDSFHSKLGLSDEEYTAKVNAGGYDNNFINDGAGYGLCQWTFWSRKKRLLEYARALDASIGDEDMQIGYCLSELAINYKPILEALKSATYANMDTVADLVTTKYEAPADQSLPRLKERRGYAREFYEQFTKPATKGYTNSPLVSCTRISPEHTAGRTHKIDRITPHCVVGQLSAEAIADCFPKGRRASCNYGVGYDGRISLIVEEKDGSWCTSSSANDNRAITIEVASDKTAPYVFTNEAYDSLVKLCVDVCKRNDIKKVLWFGSKEKSLNYSPANGECVLTVHRWFANKACPGDWMYSRMGQLAEAINKALGSEEVKEPKPSASAVANGETLYRVQVGAYKVKSNADKTLAAVKAHNVDAIIVFEGGFYKVQVGAYSIKANAQARVKAMKKKGFNCIIATVKRESESFVPDPKYKSK